MSLPALVQMAPLARSQTPTSLVRMRPRRAPFVLRNRLAIVGGTVVAVLVVAAVFAPWLMPYSPTESNPAHRFEPPTAAHWLGTDDFGRDILSRIIFGARLSMYVSLTSVAASLLVGTALGVAAAYYGGWTDTLIMRLMDIVFSFPIILLALAIVAALGAGLGPLILAIGVVFVPIFARIARGSALGVQQTEFVQAAHALGAPASRIITAHILPNITASLVVQTSLALAYAIVTDAALGFIGLGVQPPTPDWGRMLNEGRGFLATDPWVAMAPGAAIFLAVLSFNLLGDGLREAFDPRLRR